MDHQTHAREVPDIVARYFGAHDRHDIDDALALFALDATVTDESRTHSGRDEIHSWLSNAGRQYTYTRTLLDAHQDHDGAWIVRNRLDGNFPGGTAELAYRFDLVAEHIGALTIAP